MTLEDVLGCVLVLGWNGYLIYKWKSNDKKEEARKRDTEILGDVNDRQTNQTHPTPVSYTHLTLPTIYSV